MQGQKTGMSEEGEEKFRTKGKVRQKMRKDTESGRKIRAREQGWIWMGGQSAIPGNLNCCWSKSTKMSTSAFVKELDGCRST